LLLPALLAAGEAAVPVIDPSGEEMAVLQLANQHRASRPRGDNRVAGLIRTKQVAGNVRTWGQVAQIKGNAPPLVVNPILMSVARSLLKDGAKPPEQKPYDIIPVLNAAGYAADKNGLAMFGLEASALNTAYATALLNVIGVKSNNNGNIEQYAAQEALKRSWREVGIAMSGTKGTCSVIIVLGQGTAKRHIGGTVYADANRDLAYDPGEGKAGITVSCGKASMTTGASGAWWLSLDSEAEGEVVFSGDGYTATRPLPKGNDNAGIDWRLPNAADLKTADKLLADAEKVAKNADMDKKRVQLAALLSGTRMAALDDARQQRVTALTEQLQGEFDLMFSKVMESLGEEPADFKKQLSDTQKIWKGAMPAWFKEADALGKLRQQVNKVLAAPEEQQGKLAGPVLKSVQRAKATTIDPRFLEQYSTWEEQLADVMPVESAVKRR
jgi:hypothetical protein